MGVITYIDVKNVYMQKKQKQNKTIARMVNNNSSFLLRYIVPFISLL